MSVFHISIADVEASYWWTALRSTFPCSGLSVGSSMHVLGNCKKDGPASREVTLLKIIIFNKRV